MFRWTKACLFHRCSRNTKAPAERLPTQGQEDAEQALHQAQCARDAMHDLAPEVTDVSERLRQTRGRNHFAAMIKEAMEGH